MYVLPVRLVRQWNDLVGRLPERWVDAEVRFNPRDPARLDRAATLLGPLVHTTSVSQYPCFSEEAAEELRDDPFTARA